MRREIAERKKAEEEANKAAAARRAAAKARAASKPRAVQVAPLPRGDTRKLDRTSRLTKAMNVTVVSTK